MRAPAAACALLALCWCAEAAAFDYLEHAWFSDRACLEAQRRLAPLVPQDEAVAARYLALSLLCPQRWDRPYCEGGHKQLEGSINALSSPPHEGGDYSLTLGDLAALPDHLSQWGPARGLAHATRPGVTAEVFAWLSEPEGEADGVIEDVAEDACEDDPPVPWDRVEADVTRALALAETNGGLGDIPARALEEPARLPLPAGPGDPAGAYSFDNPHYLDLVLRNHHHFGRDAYASWLGFHGAAGALSRRRCAEVIAFDDDALEALSAPLPAFEGVEWGDLDEEARAARGCAALSALIKARLLRWSARADPALVAPARKWLAALGGPDAPLTAEGARLLDAVASALFGAIFEGAGLHFLQDALSGGHVRTNRAARGLEAARYDHDEDCRVGVPVWLATRGGGGRLVAFGDRYLLSPGPALEARCDWAQVEGSPPGEVSACLLRRQRGALLAVSAASLMDWAMGGLFGEEPAGAAGEGACDFPEAEKGFVCRYLPTQAPVLDGMQGAEGAPLRLAQGSLPLPPPPFSYQSLAVVGGLDLGGEEARSGARLSLLSELGALATWMTSYEVGLLLTHGGGGAPLESFTEFAYLFHWRWAARFLVNMGPYVYGGLRGFGGEEVTGFAGLGPVLGLSALPEGWIKIPLEVTVSGRLPVTLLDGRQGRGVGLEGWWLELSLGLAFQ